MFIRVPLPRGPRRSVAVFLGATLIGAAGSLPAADVTSGLVGYWPLHDVNSQTATDLSGYNHPATLQGRPTWTVGKVDAALQFLGQASAAQDAVTAAPTVDTSASFSVSAWVQLTSLTGYATAVSQDGNSVSGFFLQYTAPGTDNQGNFVGGKFSFSQLSADNPGAPSVRAASAFSPLPRTWYHLTGVRDAVAGNLRLYVNGALAATQPLPAAWKSSGVTAIGRGKYNGAPVDYFPGRIEEVRVYSRALGDADAAALASAAPIYSPIRPPATPLIVRDPYVSTWQASDVAPGTWPTFWTGAINTGAFVTGIKAITGIARIDGSPYVFFGAPNGVGPAMTQTGVEITPTQSRYLFQGAGVTLRLIFFSPVEANDLRRQSIPFGYIQAQAVSSDGNNHAVSLYFDISGEWAHGTPTTPIKWSLVNVPHTAGTLKVHAITPASQTVLAETYDYPSWGTVYWATNAATGVTYQSGADATVRAQAATQGKLNNSTDGNQPRAINDHYPVFAFNFDLGTVTGTPVNPVNLAIGHVRTPAVSYLGNNVAPLWKAYFSSWQDMVSFFYDDGASALLRADGQDDALSATSTQSNGPHYAALTALALRQAFGGTELVGTSTKPWLFLKEISSSGNVSTVDVVYPGIPAFLFTNPQFVKLLLDPIFAYTESGKWPLVYCVHDLGAHYPNADGHNDGGGENMPIEESANMLLMTAAYLNAVDSSDAAAYAIQHYKVLKQWADYLVPNTLDPQYQNQTDDFTGFIGHSSNLALKGILGVGAMGQIAQYAGKTKDQNYYSDQSELLIGQWVNLSQDSNNLHLKLAYDQPGTWSLKYNAFPDKLLGLDLIPGRVLQEEDSWYSGQEQAFGIPLDIRHSYTKADWELWTAASTDSVALRQDIVDSLFDFANTTPNRVPFTDWYDTISDTQSGFQARSVVGGLFSILARAQSGN